MDEDGHHYGDDDEDHEYRHNQRDEQGVVRTACRGLADRWVRICQHVKQMTNDERP